MPVVVGNAVGTYVSQMIITKTHRYKKLTAFGNFIGIVGFSLILARWRGDIGWPDSLYVTLPGMGMGILQSTTFIHLAASLDHSEIAIASASWFLAQNIGVLVGASFSTATINYVLGMALDRALEGVADKNEVMIHQQNLSWQFIVDENTLIIVKIIRNVLSNVQYTQNLPKAIWCRIAGAYVNAIAASNGGYSICLISNFFLASHHFRARTYLPVILIVMQCFQLLLF